MNEGLDATAAKFNLEQLFQSIKLWGAVLRGVVVQDDPEDLPSRQSLPAFLVLRVYQENLGPEHVLLEVIPGNLVIERCEIRSRVPQLLVRRSQTNREQPLPCLVGAA